jgi:Zn-dependent peptidase ImmA (M78 family)
MAENIMEIGNKEVFRLQLVWSDSPQAKTAAEFSQGDALLWVAGELVWGKESGGAPIPFPWTWVELLEFLAQAWPYISLEEGYPLGLQPPKPSLLRATAETRWQEQTAKRSGKEESAVFAFEEHHDLGRALQGAFPPSVWFVREGDLMWVASDRGAVLSPVAEVLEQLEAIGETIKARIAPCPDLRARTAIEDWDARGRLPGVELAEIATRIPAPTIRQLARALPPPERPKKSQGGFQLTEVWAAARLMVGSLGTSNIERVMSEIASLPKVNTPNLDQLTAKAGAVIDSASPKKPYDEGYALAAWFRGVMKLGESVAVEPEEILKNFYVTIKQLFISDERLDAFACWGPNHGPAVVLNPAGKHAQTLPGRRATLGHELCHLLIDRRGALPLAEVLHGLAPTRIERRARAFAAELLLPRSHAARVVRRSATVADAVATLRSESGGSQELIAWQIRNSGVALSEEALSILRSLVSDPDSF